MVSFGNSGILGVLCLSTAFLRLPSEGSASKILALALMVTQSHKITFEPLLEELARRGHEVTVVSPIIPPKKTVRNLTEILTFDLKTELRLPNIFNLVEKGEEWKPLNILITYGDICLKGLQTPEVQALKNESYDLIILPVMFNECGGAFAMSNFNVPMILVSMVSAPGFSTTFYGNPTPPSFVPFLFLGFPQRMSFYQRTISFLTEGFIRHISQNVAYPEIERKYRQILNDSSLPSTEEFMKKTSLILSNSHFSISQHRPFLPNIVEVGGMHCRSPQPLPEDLESFVNSSGSHGFILFSMGSALKSSEMSPQKLAILLSTFKKLKEKVIWKWDGGEIENLPPNVKLSKWLPQQDLLGHPKIRLFITHGGFGSTTEAVYHGVPIVGIPIFSDQKMNMKQMENIGIGISLDFLKLNEQIFWEVLQKVIQDPKFRQNVKHLSEIFRDQPTNPLDRAVYWTEYVIRHKGAPHLSSAGKDLNFFQYHSLDVIGFLLASFLAILVFGLIILRSVYRCASKTVRRVLTKVELNQKKNK